MLKSSYVAQPALKKGNLQRPPVVGLPSWDREQSISKISFFLGECFLGLQESMDSSKNAIVWVDF